MTNNYTEQIPIAEGQAVETMNGKQGVIFDIFTADDGSWAIGVWFADEEEEHYFHTNELNFIQ